MQDKPEERVESGTTPNGMERPTEENANQTATLGRHAQLAVQEPLRKSARETKFVSHLKDFIINKSWEKHLS